MLLIYYELVHRPLKGLITTSTCLQLKVGSQCVWAELRIRRNRESLLTEVWLISRFLEVQGHRLYQMFTAQT